LVFAGAMTPGGDAMNRLHMIVTTLVAVVALGFTLRTLGQHEVEVAAGPAANGPTPYSADSARIPPADPNAETPPTF
jgi:hypothetical protein